jgi:hypothetical protein
MIEELDLFPTKFFSIKLEENELLSPLTKEVYENREEIKSLSWATQEQSCENYITDFVKPKQYASFNRISEYLRYNFSEMGYAFDMDMYWTAFYKKFSIHEIHAHKPSILTDTNYSGVLYLSSIGSTNFFSSNPSSFYNTIQIESEYGRIVMFPSNVPHQAITNFDSDVERCIIAFNFRLATK